LNHLRRLRRQGAPGLEVDAHDREVAGVGRNHQGRYTGRQQARAGGVSGAGGAVDPDGLGDRRRRQARRGAGDRCCRRAVEGGGAAAERQRHRPLGRRIGQHHVVAHGDAELEKSCSEHQEDRRGDRELDDGHAAGIDQHADEAVPPAQAMPSRGLPLAPCSTNAARYCSQHFLPYQCKGSIFLSLWTQHPFGFGSTGFGLFYLNELSLIK